MLSSPIVVTACREQGVVPPEKKKKGKRKSEVQQEALESDDTASLTAVAVGGEESNDPLDSTVSVSASRGQKGLELLAGRVLLVLTFFNSPASLSLSLFPVLPLFSLWAEAALRAAGEAQKVQRGPGF